MKTTYALCAVVAAAVLSGCAGIPNRDIGMVAGAAVGAEANQRYPIRGAVAGGVLGALAGMMVDQVYGPAYGPRWRTNSPQGRYWSPDGEGTRCDTDTRQDYQSGAVVVIQRCTSRLERPIPGGIESCYASFEAKSTNGGPFVVVRDNGSCRTTYMSGGYRTYPR